MKILLTGIHGQVGSSLFPLLAPLATVLAPPRSELDLSDMVAVAHWMRRERPDLVINAAAYTAVDRAEQDTEQARLLNSELPRQLGLLLAEWQGCLVHYSTDYVFDGTRAVGGYTEDDDTCPLGVYGQTKRAGEVALLAGQTPSLVFRTSWVYSLHGKNFLNTMLRLGRERDELRVVDDQWGAPTWAASIAQATVSVLQRFALDQPLAPQWRLYHGLYHMTNGGVTTWCEFTRQIFQRRPECHAQVHPIPSSAYPSPVRRPANSRLDNGKLERTFAVRLPEWQAALDTCLAALPALPES